MGFITEDERRAFIKTHDLAKLLRRRQQRIDRPRSMYATEWPREWYEDEIKRRSVAGELPTPLPDELAMLLMEVTANGET